MVMINWSTAAMAGPIVKPSSPTARAAWVCRPKTALGFGLSNTPSLSIRSAPPSSPGGGPSSAGWKMNFTVPGSERFILASTDATPN